MDPLIADATDAVHLALMLRQTMTHPRLRGRMLQPEKLPRRESLVSQVIELLEAGIRSGAWREWLPGERALCEQFQVSRNTVRAAIVQMQRNGIVEPVHGAGTRVLGAKASADKVPSSDVAVLSPEPLERLRPMQAFWIGDLRAMLNERSQRLHVFHGSQYFRTNPGPALKRLIEQNPHACWILTKSNAGVQAWFDRNKIPCVVAGTVHAGLELPSRDWDHRAMCRHAAGVLLGLGHTRIALVITKSNLAGDLASEAGFGEGLKKPHASNVDGFVARHDGTISGIRNLVRRLVEQDARVTGLVVANAYHYLTVADSLTAGGLRIPKDVSVISRDDEVFLSYVLPEPARYVANSKQLAKALLGVVLDLQRHVRPSRREKYLMPVFVRGESVARKPFA